jgi:threonine/homoserine/homoserine lactone efflux protein
MDATSLPAIFVFSFILAIGAVMSPGPVAAAIVSQAPRQGWRVGPLLAFGHSLLELLIVALIAFGLQSLLAHPAIQIAIALLGGALLIWMGGTTLLKLSRGQLRLPLPGDRSAPMSAAQLVRLGMIATLVNPFWYAWWITVPPSYLAQSRALGLLPLVAFYLGHISADFAWDTILSSALGGGRPWISQRVYAAINALCGLFFIYLGASFAVHGVQLLTR